MTKGDSHPKVTTEGGSQENNTLTGFLLPSGLLSRPYWPPPTGSQRRRVPTDAVRMYQPHGWRGLERQTDILHWDVEENAEPEIGKLQCDEKDDII